MKQAFGYCRAKTESEANERADLLRTAALAEDVRAEVFWDYELTVRDQTSYSIGGITFLFDSIERTKNFNLVLLDEKDLGVSRDFDAKAKAIELGVRLFVIEASRRRAPRPRPVKPQPWPTPKPEGMTSRRVEALLQGRRDSAAKGNHVSGPVPFGYRRVGTMIEPDEDEANLVRKLFSLYLTSGMTLRKVAEEINRSHTTRSGKLWTRAALHWLIRNPIYVGFVRFAGVGKVRGHHKPIVSPIIFNKSQAKLRSQDKKAESRKISRAPAQQPSPELPREASPAARTACS